MKNKDKKRDSFRFYISQSNRRSCSWIIWSNKDDLYVACRNTANIMKASLHQSGWLNFSHTTEYYKHHKTLPYLNDRHFAKQKLNISEHGVQYVLKIEFPLKEMLSEDDGNLEEGIQRVEIPENWNGVITVFFVHFPEIIRKNFKNYDSIPNLMKTFSEGKFALMWEHHPNKILKTGDEAPSILFGEVKNRQMLREVTIGYDEDFTMGGFIDRKFTEYCRLEE